MKANKKYIAVAVIVAVLAVPLLVKMGRGESSKEVEIAVAAEQEIRPTILASGVLAYRNEVDLTSELVAKVREILVEEGDTVEQGQLLLRLDPETYRNAIDREQATRRQAVISIERQRLALALAEKRLARGEQLVAQKMIGQSEFDDLRNARDLAKVELDSSQEALRRADAILGEAREQLAKTDILAPIAGTIVSLPIKVGETAIPSTNALAGAIRPMTRGMLARAAELYAERFGEADGRIPATFEIIHLAGWAPHESQQKPLPRGSAKMRLADALGVTPGGLEPAKSGPVEAVELGRRQIAAAYGVEPSRVRIMIEL